VGYHETETSARPDELPNDIRKNSNFSKKTTAQAHHG
jgi:hypothetical protein